MEGLENKPRVAIARNTARKLLVEMCIADSPIVINDVVRHLKKSYDLHVIPWNFGKDTSGIQTSEGEIKFISYNKNQHVHRQRFTVAHEIGHLLLGHTNINYDHDLYSTKPEDIEADQFAAELLIPLQMIKGDVRDGCNNIPLLAKKYNVSEEVVWLRLKSCGLINKL